MTLLHDARIRAMLRDGYHFSIDDLRPNAVQPCSVDVTLGESMKRMVRGTRAFSLQTPPFFQEISPNITNGWTLWPGEFYLGHTEEKVRFGPRIAGKVEGRSSWGRIGLEVHATAGWIDPGFEGQLTLEMKVVGVNAITVQPGDVIAQLCFFWMPEAVSRPYGHPDLGSHYQGQTGPTEAVQQ